MTALVAVLIKLTTSATTDRDVASNFEPLEFDIERARVLANAATKMSAAV